MFKNILFWLFFATGLPFAAQAQAVDCEFDEPGFHPYLSQSLVIQSAPIGTPWSPIQTPFAVHKYGLLRYEICSDPILKTDHKDFDGVGILTTRSQNSDDKKPCTFAHLGDNRLLTAAHCVMTKKDKWRVPTEENVQLGYNTSNDTGFSGCRAIQYCVPTKWADDPLVPRGRDLALVRVEGCDFSSGTPATLEITAHTTAELTTVKAARLTGYLDSLELQGRTHHTIQENEIWTSLRRQRNYIDDTPDEGLLCHTNSTTHGTSGAPVTDKDLTEVYCVHAYGSYDGTQCGTKANACAVITDADVTAMKADTLNTTPTGYTCAKISYDNGDVVVE